MVNSVTTGQEKISDQWACWGLSFFIQVDLFSRNKNGSNIYDLIDSAALSGSFLLLWGFYWTAGWTLSETSPSHCQDRTHESESGVNAAATHVWKTTYNRGTHTVNRWRLQHITINLQLHHRTAAQRPTLAHTQTKTALTSFSSSSV